MKGTTANRGILVLCGIVSLLASPGWAATQQPQSEQAQQIMALVDKAAALIESKGKQAFPDFKRKGSEWYTGDTYLFVIDMNGTNRMYPVKLELEGRNIMDMKDVHGKPIVQEFLTLLSTQDSGWVDYMWPRPGEEQPSRKISYIKKAKMPDGQMVSVGAGIYAE